MFKQDYDDWLSTPPRDWYDDYETKHDPDYYIKVGSEWRYIGDDEEC